MKGRGIKASGGGYDNYFYGIQAKAPDGIFDFAKSIFDALNVPHLSIDLAFDGSSFYLIEFQCLYFGTAGIPYSNEYFVKIDNGWAPVSRKYDVEKVYVDSIIRFIDLN